MVSSLGILLGCGEAPARGRVLLVGIDGASLRIVEPMMEDGRLPNLSGLARDGAHGIMRSYPPLRSPRIWTSIATGKAPEKHQILHFTLRRGDGKRGLVSSRDRVGHALWNMLSDHGFTVGVVNWWVTYPPERISGVMVSDHFMPKVVQNRLKFFRADHLEEAPVVFPEVWQERVSTMVANRSDHVDGSFANLVLPAWVRRDVISNSLLSDSTVAAVALQVEEQLEPDVLLVLMKGIDPASHVLFATVLPPDELERPLPVSAEERQGGAELLRRVYEHADRLLGRLLERYGPDDLVVVVSDHGFEARRRYAILTGQHRGAAASEAVIFARGPGIEAGTKARNIDIYDVTPTILAWLGMPLADDMDGQPWPFLETHETARIASYDTRPVERVGTNSAGYEASIIKQLEALGYFEDVEEAHPQEPPLH